MFTTKTSVDFGPDTPDGRTVLELVAGDRPGLLSKVGKTFMAEGIDIDTAKIMTIGERAEDVFYITDEAGQPLSAAKRQDLRNALLAKLGADTPGFDFCTKREWITQCKT